MEAPESHETTTGSCSGVRPPPASWTENARLAAACWISQEGRDGILSNAGEAQQQKKMLAISHMKVCDSEYNHLWYLWTKLD